MAAGLAICTATGLLVGTLGAVMFGEDPDPRRMVIPASPSRAEPIDMGPTLAVAQVQLAAPVAAPIAETWVRQSVPQRTGHVVSVGKNSAHAVDPVLERAFVARCPDLTDSFLTCNDRDVVDQLLLGRADFGVIGGKLSPREVHAGLRQTRVGVELFALVVAADSPVRSLTRTQVRQILTGAVTQWRELGQAGGAIVVVAPSDNQLAERAERALIPGDALAQNAVRVASDRHVADQLLQNKAAIGIVRRTAAPLEAGQRLLQIDWFAPSLEAFDYGTYPFGQAVHVITSGEATGAAKQFLEFARSNEGRGLLGRTLLL